MDATAEAANTSLPHVRPVSALQPSFADLLILLALFWAFLAYPGSWDSFNGDANTGLHVRTGEYILSHGRVPTQDLYSFSKPGETWYAFEWLSCTIYAALHHWFGLQGIVAMSAILLITLPALWLRESLARGATPLIALPFVLVGFRAGAIHFLARPHLFTMFLFTIAVALIDQDRRRSGRAIWLLLPLTTLWTNLHGGFAILPVYLGALVAGNIAERKFPAAKRYTLLTIGCLAASLINPYGLRLHIHIVKFLGSNWLAKMVQEYAPITTYHGDDRIYFYYGLLAAAAIATVLLVRQRRFVEPIWLALLGYAAFHSARHIPVFVIAAVPILAAEFSGVWRKLLERLPARSTLQVVNAIFEDMAPRFRRISVWALAVFGMVLLCDLPKEFPRSDYPTALIERNHTLLASSRLFTTDHWADFVVYRYYPDQRVFVDGRSDFYGQAIGQDFLSVLEAEPNWREVAARWKFDAMLVPENSRIAEALRSSPDWTPRDKEARAVLFLRR